MFNEYVTPRITSQPPVPWDQPGGVLDKWGLKVELPDGWTLEMVSGKKGKKRTAEELNLLSDELVRKPCRIKITRKD
jgi:hypothetical protein